MQETELKYELSNILEILLVLTLVVFIVGSVLIVDKKINTF